jgi:hypothetical protein
MEAVAASTPGLSESGGRRLDAALRRVAGRPRPDLDAARRELENILGSDVA